ncbi:hypothetical protein JCM13664_16580 [Methylothermus subterraneus]
MVGSKERRCWCRSGLWLLAVALTVSAAPNRVEEARLLEALAEDPHPGQTVEIPLGAEKFVAIYAPSFTQTARGAVVFLPEAGLRADFTLAVELMRYLSAHGWEVLSLQLPVQEPEAPEDAYFTLLEDAAARLKAATAWLKSQGRKSIAAVGHGFGALAVLKHLADSDPELQAAVLLSLAWPKSADASVQAWLQAVRLPVLDVYAEQDSRPARALAQTRRLRLKDKPGYRQLLVSTADHDYRGQEGLLARRIDGWLRQVGLKKEGEK